MSIKKSWLNYVLHLGSVSANLKNKFTDSHGLTLLIIGLGIILSELFTAIISLPLYIFLKPEDLGIAGEKAVHSFRLRRIISLGTLAFIILIFVVLFSTGLLALPGQSKANSETTMWSFDSSIAYVYDPIKIQIVDGMALFKGDGIVETTPTIETIVPTTNASTETTPEITPTPIVESTSIITPTPEPTPAPVVEPAPQPEAGQPSAEAPVVPPSAPTSPLLFNNLDSLRNILSPQKALAQNLSNTLLCEATVIPTLPKTISNLKEWTNFIETAQKGTGEIYYALSDDLGITWKYWDGLAWSVALPTNYNTADVINAHITSFYSNDSLTYGLTNTITFRATMKSDCHADISLLDISILYDTLPAPEPVVEPIADITNSVDTDIDTNIETTTETLPAENTSIDTTITENVDTTITMPTRTAI